MKRVWIICLVIGFLMPLKAQDAVTDSLQNKPLPLCVQLSTHRLNWKEIVIPASLVGISALSIENGWFKKQKMNVQDALSAKGKKKIKVDDYIQYSPMVVGYGLGFTGVQATHSLKERTLILSMSYATMGIVVRSMKLAFNEKRPDSNATNSFPSGHTATAFMGAQYLYEEYKDISPWIGYAGYAVAATTGYLRIYNNRHYINDVVAGACVGILSTKFAYWLYPKLFKKSVCNQGFVVGMPYFSNESAGLNLVAVF